MPFDSDSWVDMLLATQRMPQNYSLSVNKPNSVFTLIFPPVVVLGRGGQGMTMAGLPEPPLPDKCKLNVAGYRYFGAR